MARQERMDRWLFSLFSDCRFALRQLRKSPGFAVTAVLTLAPGIGSTTAIFSVVNGVLLNPYPYKNNQRRFRLLGRDVILALHQAARIVLRCYVTETQIAR